MSPPASSSIAVPDSSNTASCPRNDRLGGPQGALVDGEPRDAVSFGRRVAPALPVFQCDVQIVDIRGGANRAGRMAVAAEDHPHGAVRLYLFGSDILALRGTVLLRGGQGQPELEAAQGFTRRGPAVMPHTVSGLHPLDPARRDRALLSGRVLIGQAATKHDRERCDARVRMNPESGSGPGATSKWSRNTKGLISSPISEGLTRRVMGPWRRPLVGDPASAAFGGWALLEVEATDGGRLVQPSSFHLHWIDVH